MILIVLSGGHLHAMHTCKRVIHALLHKKDSNHESSHYITSPSPDPDFIVEEKQNKKEKSNKKKPRQCKPIRRKCSTVSPTEEQLDPTIINSPNEPLLTEPLVILYAGSRYPVHE